MRCWMSVWSVSDFLRSGIPVKLNIYDVLSDMFLQVPLAFVHRLSAKKHRLCFLIERNLPTGASLVKS